MALVGALVLIIFGIAASIAFLTGNIGTGLVLAGIAVGGAVIVTKAGGEQKTRDAAFRAAPRASSDTPSNVPVGPLKLVQAEPYEKEDSDGETLRGVGYHVRTADADFAVAHRDLTLEDTGAEVVNVAGTAYRPDVLESEAATAGSRLHLRAAPNNEHDPNAVEIHVEGEEDTHLGFVPATEAPRFQPLLLRGEQLEALVLWEWQDVDDERRYVNALVYRPGVVDTTELA